MLIRKEELELIKNYEYFKFRMMTNELREAEKAFLRLYQILKKNNLIDEDKDEKFPYF